MGGMVVGVSHFVAFAGSDGGFWSHDGLLRSRRLAWGNRRSKRDGCCDGRLFRTLRLGAMAQKGGAPGAVLASMGRGHPVVYGIAVDFGLHCGVLFVACRAVDAISGDLHIAATQQIIGEGVVGIYAFGFFGVVGMGDIVDRKDRRLGFTVEQCFHFGGDAHGICVAIVGDFATRGGDGRDLSHREPSLIEGLAHEKHHRNGQAQQISIQRVFTREFDAVNDQGVLI